MLGALLVAQVLVFVWLTDRVVGWAAQSPEELVSSVASDLSTALTKNPGLRLDTYVRDAFSHIYRPFVVVMVDGRAASNRPNGLPPGYVRAVQQRLRREESLNAVDPRDGGRGGRGGRDRGFDRRREPGSPDSARSGSDGRPDGPPDARPDGPPDFRPGDGPGEPPRGSASAPIVLATETGAAATPIGFVVIPINPPPVFVAIRELGPTLTWVGLILLAMGAASAALLIFSPAHRRLRTLEQAARALGEGRTDVRAVEGGGDEVSTLAHAFNRMADDLGARAEALAASDRARRQLLADVSHELMTPLAAVRGYTETLAMPELTPRRLDTQPVSRHHRRRNPEARIADWRPARPRAPRRRRRLADVRGSAGQGALQPDRRSARSGHPRPADHARRLRDATGPDGPRRRTAARTGAAEPGGQRPEAHAGRWTVVARGRRRADGTRITVRDTGPGIPSEHLPHVFERFYKADAARSATRMSGSGLGLSIVQAIVERHRGTVTATNAPDGGAALRDQNPPARPPAVRLTFSRTVSPRRTRTGRRVQLKPVLADFDSVRPFGELDHELIFAGRRRPDFAVDDDVRVCRPHAQQERAELGWLAATSRRRRP